MFCEVKECHLLDGQKPTLSFLRLRLATEWLLNIGGLIVYFLYDRAQFHKCSSVNTFSGQIVISSLS